MAQPTRKRRLAVAASLIALSVSALLPISAVAAPGPMTIDVTLGTTCVRAKVPAGTPSARIVWKDAELNVKVDTVEEADADGNIGACVGNDYVEIGDRVRVRVGSASHLLIVPELTLVQDRVNDHYRGRGPAGDYVRLICGLTNGFEPCVQSWKIKVNSAGNWGYNPGWDIFGGDFMSLNWTSSAGDKVRRLNYAPFVVVTIDKAAVSGSTQPGTSSDVLLMKANGAVRGGAAVTGGPIDGLFQGRFEKDTTGERVLARVGNLVSSDIASDAEFIIRDVEAAPNVGTQRVPGQCPTPTGRFVRAWSFRDGAEVDGAYSWPDGDGSFRLTTLEFESGDRLLISCDLSTGDRIQKWFAVP